MHRLRPPAALWPAALALSGLVPAWTTQAGESDPSAPVILPEIPGLPTALVPRELPDMGMTPSPAWIVPGQGQTQEAVFLDGWQVPAPKDHAAYDLVDESRQLLAVLEHFRDPRADDEDEDEQEEPKDPKTMAADAAAKTWNDKYQALQRSIPFGISLPMRCALLRKNGQAQLATALETTLETLGVRDPGSRLISAMDMNAYQADTALQRFASAWSSGRTDEARYHLRQLQQRWPQRLAEENAWPRIQADLRRREIAAFNPMPHLKETEHSTLPPAELLQHVLARLDECATPAPEAWMSAAIKRIGPDALPALAQHMQSDTRLTRLIACDKEWAYSPRSRIQSQVCTLRTCEAKDIAARLALELAGVPLFEMNGGDAENDENHSFPPEAVATVLEFHRTQSKLDPVERQLNFIGDTTRSVQTRWDTLCLLTREQNDPKQLALDHPRLPALISQLLPDLFAGQAQYMLYARGQQDLLGLADMSTHWNNTFLIGPVAAAKQLAPLQVPAVRQAFLLQSEAADKPEDRMAWAMGLSTLGDPAPLQAACEALAEGADTSLSGNDDPEDRTPWKLEPDDLYLNSLLQHAANYPPISEALWSIIKPDHPLNPTLIRGIRRFDLWSRGLQMDAHPVVLMALAADLAVTEESGCTYTATNGNLQFRIQTNRFSTSRQEPATGDLQDPALLLESAVETRADHAAALLGKHCAGCPQAHALFKDQAARLEAVRQYASRFISAPGHLRACVGAERVLGPKWIPDFKRLDHPATEADVQNNLAIFSAGTGATLTNLPLPAIGHLTAREAQRNAYAKVHPGKPIPLPMAEVVVAQAEKDASGQVWLGIIEQNAIRKVKVEEIGNLQPYDTRPKSETEKMEADPKQRELELQRLRFRARTVF